MNTADLIWTFASFVLTLLVLSYLLGDNPLFRFATALFVGVAAGYVLVVSLYQVVWPKLIWRLIQPEVSLPEKGLLLVPLVLSILLMLKLFPKISRAGNGAMAYLVGTGAAVAIGGAVLGTLFPQSIATANLFDLSAPPPGSSTGGQLLEGLFMVVGVSATLVYFYFGVRAKPDQAAQRNPAVEVTAQVGQIFIAITLGALFAGVYLAAISALVERVHYLWNFIAALFV